jgi:hypothetical protein
MTEEEFRFRDLRLGPRRYVVDGKEFYLMPETIDVISALKFENEVFTLGALAQTHGLCESTMQLRLDEMLPVRG